MVIEQEIVISLTIFFSMRSLIFLFVVCILIGCGPVKPADENITALPENPDEVVFMAFQIKRDSLSQNNTISLINTTKTKARIKKQTEPESHSGNYLIAEILKSGKPTQTIKITHPLFVHIEYADDSGKYISKDAVIDNAEFFIRFQNHDAHSIRWTEFLKDRPKKELLTLNF